MKLRSRYKLPKVPSPSNFGFLRILRVQIRFLDLTEHSQICLQNFALELQRKSKSTFQTKRVSGLLLVLFGIRSPKFWSVFSFIDMNFSKPQNTKYLYICILRQFLVPCVLIFLLSVEKHSHVTEAQGNNTDRSVQCMRVKIDPSHKRNETQTVIFLAKIFKSDVSSDFLLLVCCPIFVSKHGRRVNPCSDRGPRQHIPTFASTGPTPILHTVAVASARKGERRDVEETRENPC